MLVYNLNEIAGLVLFDYKFSFWEFCIVKNFPEDRRTYEVVSDSVADQRIFARQVFHANLAAKSKLDPFRVQDKWTNIKSKRRKWDKILHTLRSIHCENKTFLSLIFTWEGAERQTHNVLAGVQYTLQQPTLTNQRPVFLISANQRAGIWTMMTTFTLTR